MSLRSFYVEPFTEVAILCLLRQVPHHPRLILYFSQVLYAQNSYVTVKEERTLGSTACTGMMCDLIETATTLKWN